MDFNIRPPAAAGTFYPDDKVDLSKFIDENINYKIIDQHLNTNAIIVPHAGYRFSGKTASKAFSLVKPGSFKRAIIIGPSHYVSFHGVSIAPYEKYLTPLGPINVDTTAVRSLTKQCKLIVQQVDVHDDEHSIEVELPFIQKLTPSCKIIPMVVGRLDYGEILEIGQILSNWWDEHTLVVISSDFVHYGTEFNYSPFSVANAPVKIKELDMEAIGLIKDKNADQFVDFIHRTGATICGNIPISILLSIVEKFRFKTEFNLVEYTNSGEILGDHTNSVSYAAISLDFDTTYLTKSKPIFLSHYDRVFLLNSAFCSIKARFENTCYRTPDETPPYLLACRSVFVSLHIDGDLRGCIGSLSDKESIIEGVIENAEKAAFEDPRFSCLSFDEFKKLNIEISVLTHPRKINSINEVILGKHGVILKRNSNRAIFLPQVAIEHGWSLEETLEILSQKAGLNKDAWKLSDTSLSIFETNRFECDYVKFLLN